MQYEAILFLLSLGTGAVLLLLYQVLTALRNTVPHHPAVCACEDLIYWTAAGFFLFSVLYRFHQGILRSFFFFGCLLGAWVCRLTAAPLLRIVLERFFGIFVTFVKFSTKRLIFRIKRCNIFVCKFRNSRIKKKDRSRKKRSSRVEKK